MIGMTFSAFLTLAVLGLISSFVLHVVGRYRVLAGWDGFISAWIAGWLGAWLGSPVLGHWAFHFGNIYILPALLGAFIGSFLVAAAVRTAGATATVLTRPGIVAPQAGSGSQVEMRKAS
jgi:uncharacterized membrane protein YeaQ/YmgE (transglycosylase-associated protein family)